MNKKGKRLIILLTVLLAALTAIVCACTPETTSTAEITIVYGLEGTDNETLTVPFDYQLFAELNKKIPADTDFIFAGWFLQDGTEVTSSVKTDKDLTVTAKWKVLYQTEYWLEQENGAFEKSDELSAQSYGFLGETLNVNASDVIGYAFDSQNSSNIISAKLTNNGQAFKLYYLRAAYSVAFDKNLASAQGSMPADSVIFGAAYSAPDCDFTSNFSFVCWNTAPDGSGVDYNAGDALTLRQNVTLYAQWSNEYTVELYTEQPDGTWSKQTQTKYGIIGKKAAADTTVSFANHFFDAENASSVTEGIVTEQGLTLKIYFALVTRTVTYHDDGTKVTLKHGQSFIVRTPEEGSNILSYCTSSTGNGKEYAFGEVVTLTENLTLYPIIVDIYLADDGSGDILRVRRNMTGKGAAVLVPYGGEAAEGFLVRVNDALYFEILTDDGSINGKIFEEDDTFRYRNEEEVGTYGYYDYLYDELYTVILLALDGYGTGVLALPADDGTDRIMNYFCSYELSEYGDYYMQYYFPANPQDVYEGYFLFDKQTFEGYEELNGYFMLYGNEGGTYGLVYNFEIQENLLELDGYGAGEMYVLDNDGNKQSSVKGFYYASEDYADERGEYVFVPEDVNADAFYFILTYTEYNGQIVPLFMIKRGEAGTYTEAEGQVYPELYLDGYGGALYTSEENTAGRLGSYTIETAAEGYIVVIEFTDAAGGTLAVKVDGAAGLFAPYESGFIINENGELTAYLGSASVITVPEGVTSIAANVFKDINITSVTLPSTLTAIGDYAFQNSAGETSVSVLKTVYFLSANPPVLGAGVFRWPGGEFKIIVPDGSEDAYRNAESWSAYAKYVTSQAEINNKPEFQIDDNGVLFAYNNSDENPWAVEITIPDGATAIADGVFANRTYITKVNLNNVTAIGAKAFYGCSGLTEILFNPSTKTIGAEAFYQCTSLSSVNLGAVETIGASAFNRCFNLDNVTIGSSVTSIGQLAFAMCAVTVNEDETEITQRDLRVTIAAEAAPVLGKTVFNGSVPRVYVLSYEIGIEYANEPTWFIYVGSLRVTAAETAVWYSKSNMGSVLELGDRILLDEGAAYGLYKIENDKIYVAWFNKDSFTAQLEIVEQIGTIRNGIMDGLQIDGVNYTFVTAGTQVTYTTSADERLTVNFGSADAMFNGNPVVIEIVNYRMRFSLDGYIYAVTLSNDETFTYAKTKIEVTETYTAADGSTLTIKTGDTISANGRLEDVDGNILYTETWSWLNITDCGNGVYTWFISWRSDKYFITATVTGDTFSYTWEKNSETKVYTDAEGNKAVVTVKTDGTVTGIHILFKTVNDTQDCNATFTKISDGVYTVIIASDVPVYDDNGVQTGTEPSVFNGTYTLTLKTDGTFTLVKTV